MASDEEIIRQLTALVRTKTGDLSARISGVSALPGHAGQSYGFEIETGQGAGVKREHLVLRLAPEGVRPVGTADVVRQARIMKSLEGTAVPVPPVRWLDEDPAAFGRPYSLSVSFAATSWPKANASIRPPTRTVLRARSCGRSAPFMRFHRNRAERFGARRFL